MTLQTTETPRPRTFLRSTGAILLGLVTVFVLSLATDQIFHALDIYPPWGQPMQDNRFNALALAFRCLYAIVGSTIAARFVSRHAEGGGLTFA